MPKVRLIVLVFALAACTPGAASSVLPSVPSVVPTPVASTAAPSVSGAPEPSGACIDRGQLADTADSANTALQGMAAALKANNGAEASTLAGTAASQLRSLATLVEAVRPIAAATLRNAADRLDNTKASMADATAAAPAIQALFNQAFDLAMAGACPA